MGVRPNHRCNLDLGNFHWLSVGFSSAAQYKIPSPRELRGQVDELIAVSCTVLHPRLPHITTCALAYTSTVLSYIFIIDPVADLRSPI